MTKKSKNIIAIIIIFISIVIYFGSFLFYEDMPGRRNDKIRKINNIILLIAIIDEARENRSLRKTDVENAIIFFEKLGDIDDSVEYKVNYDEGLKKYSIKVTLNFDKNRSYVRSYKFDSWEENERNYTQTQKK